MRRSVITALGLAALLVTNLQPAAYAETTTETRHPSGLVLLDPEPVAPNEMSEEAGQRLNDAKDLAEAHPDDLAHPWFDHTTGTVVLTAVTDYGEELVAQFQADSFRDNGTPTQSRRVSRSLNGLEFIKNDAIELSTATVPDSDAIFMTGPDAEHNRVTIYVSRMSDALLNALAQRYGTEAVAIQHIPEAAGTGDARDNDKSPFYGGAKIYNPDWSTCTSGFSWRSNGYHYMLTAGHCAPNGGDIFTPASYIGYVNSGSRENWKTGTGTVYLSGQFTYRGDIALSSVVSSKESAAVIYRGGPGSGSVAAVGQMWSRRAASGDRYCVGGHVTGEKCSWTVYATGYNFKLNDGSITRNVVRSFWRNDGVCTSGGDSGGPVYTVRSDGKVAAKGIHHGRSRSSIWGCMNVFTDIWDAYYGLPGYLATA